MNDRKSRSILSLGAWARLVRLPNLLTVPGDPLVGYLLASEGCLSWDIVLCGLVSLCLYCSGMVLNDVVDRVCDRRDRPGRPIASGEIGVGIAITVAIVLMLGGVVIAWLISPYTFIIAGLIAASVVVYNIVGKHIPLLGPVNMGLCRGLSVYLGASALGLSSGANYTAALTAAIITGLYIASVTAIARDETRRQRISIKRFLPAITLLPWTIIAATMALLGIVFQDISSGFAAAIAAASAVIALKWAWICAKKLAGTPPPSQVQEVVGSMIRNLLLIQAMFILALAAWRWPAYPAGIIAIIAIALYILMPISTSASRWFYSS